MEERTGYKTPKKAFEMAKQRGVVYHPDGTTGIVIVMADGSFGFITPDDKLILPNTLATYDFHITAKGYVLD